MGDKLFFVGVKGLVQNPAGELLLLRADVTELRGNKEPYWDLPGGRIAEGSTELETLQREINEEIGKRAIVQAVYLETVISNHNIPIDGGGFAGLVLRIWNVSVDQIDDIVLSDEHDQLGWFSPAKSSDLLANKYSEAFCKTVAALETE